MVIKSKKWKSIISFSAFLTGVSLILTGGGAVAEQIVSSQNTGEVLAFTESDYQNSRDFKNEIENEFSNFLSMATGSELGYFYNVSGQVTEGAWIDYGTYEFGKVSESVTVVEEYGYAQNGAGMEQSEVPTIGGETEAERKQRILAEAETYHNNIKNDRNLLYRISSADGVLYSNFDGVSWNAPGDAMPEGYNFLFCFDGEKVTIAKEGKEIDVYGDGYYRDSAQWYVPGYKNFTADEALKEIEIVMLAAAEPLYYTHATYGENGFVRSGNELYHIAERMERLRSDLKRAIVMCAVGLLLLGVYLILRREKKQADAAVGRWIGKIWVEGKLLIVAALFLLVFVSPWMLGYSSYKYMDIIYEVSYGGYSFQGAAPILIQWIISNSAMLLTLVWTVYFAVLDIRTNRGHLWQGAISRLAKAVSTGMLKQPFAKQQVKRAGLLFVSSLTVTGAALAVMFYGAGKYISMPFLFLTVVIWTVVFAGIFFWYLAGVRREAEEMDLLTARIMTIHDGDYETGEYGADGAVLLPETSPFKAAADSLEEISHGMERAIDERIRSERMKVELVANVSHDIKTPLTSIISYIQFLKQEEELPEHVKDYIRILDEKSERLKNMVQDVFAVSKAASGQLLVESEILDFGKLLRQTLADMQEDIDKSPVVIKAEIPEQPVMICADGKRMYRVFQNLLQNALKYSLEGSRVYLTLKEDGTFATASIKNTSRQELTVDTDFTERFVRGDESRTDGGSGLGLSIARSFTEACGGSFKIEMIADLFVVTVAFPTEK